MDLYKLAEKATREISISRDDFENGYVEGFVKACDILATIANKEGKVDFHVIHTLKHQNDLQ
jgi:hypothetical protein